jgi:hypothetical protein
MEDLATKSDEKTGGSWGIGKALYFGMSRLYTAMVNTTLHPDHPLDGATHGRIFGRTEMGWHQVEGKTYSGQGFFGLREKTAEGDLARSSWGDGDLARALFLDRASDRPGTSILTLAFHDPESPEATLTDLQSGIEQAWREHFWPLLVRQRVAVTISTADGHDLRADPIRLDRENLDSDLVELLDRYDQGEALSAPGDTGMSSGTVVSVPIPVLVPPRRDGSEESFTHECQLVVRATDRTGGPPRNRVSYVRGPEMVVRSDDQSGLDPATFDAILLAGKAVLPLGVPITADIERAEAYFRSSEPPAHDEWGSGRKLAERYSGTFRKPLHDLPTQVSKALWDLFEQVATESEDAPKELRDLLRIGTDVKDPKPQVVSLTGAVDGDRWDVTFNIRVTDRPEGWWLEPRIAQVGETSARSALEWDDPLESDRGVVVGHRITLPTRGTGRAYSFSVTGRTKPVAADAEHRREQLPAGRSVIAVDIARSGRPTSGGEA